MPKLLTLGNWVLGRKKPFNLTFDVNIQFLFSRRNQRKMFLCCKYLRNNELSRQVFPQLKVDKTPYQEKQRKLTHALLYIPGYFAFLVHCNYLKIVLFHGKIGATNQLIALILSFLPSALSHALTYQTNTGFNLSCIYSDKDSDFQNQ